MWNRTPKKGLEQNIHILRTRIYIIEQDIEKDGGMMNIMKLISAIEGRGYGYIGSQKSIDTAKAVMNFVQGRATEVDSSLISRSNGATMLLTAIEGNKKAWDSVDKAAGRELAPAKTKTTQGIQDVAKAVKNTTISEGNVYTKDGIKATIGDVKIENNIVVDAESVSFKNDDAKGYGVLEKWATELKKPVKLVKGLYNENGDILDGVETDSGIFINTEAKNPIKWAATHEFSHTMKKSAGEAWAKYQNFVVDKMKKDGSYYDVFNMKAIAYGTRDAAYINEEIACDHIGETFDSVDELADFIKKDRGLAVRVRDFYYKALDKLGLLDEKKKAQLMWRDAYRKAVLNVKDGKVESTGKTVEKSVSGTRVSETNGDDKITADMDEHKRAEILKKTSLNVVEAKSDALKLTLEEINILESKCKSKAQGVMEELCEKFGVVKEGYTNNNIELEFNYSKGSLRESVHKQNERNPNFQDFAKMLTVFDSVVKNAVPIESHTDKYKGTKKENPNLKQSYVLLSAFKSGEDIAPVELNIREFKKSVGSRLYMSVTLKKIRADILAPYDVKEQRNGTPSTLNISIAELIKNVNPSDGDFLRYAPDEMLNEAQIESKREALERDRLKIEGLKKSIRGTRLSDVDSSPAGESVDTTTEDTSQKFIPPGAEPRRDVKVPESVEEDTKVRQFARTAAEAETLTDKTAEGVLENVEKGKFNYTPISNKSAMKNAYASLDTMGVEWVEKKVNGAISSHNLDKKTVAMAEVLLEKYSQEGQEEKAQRLIIDFAAESTRTAQILQAISMLKKLDPNYEVAYIEKVIQNLKEEIVERNNKKFGKKHSTDIEVSEELKTKLMEAKTEEERETIRDEIYTEIADQLPNTWINKWNAWRYMSMLANARTHVRNVVGNTAFMPMIATKNIAAKFVEPIVAKATGGKIERSKTFIVPKKYRQFAMEDVEVMRKELQGGGKHNPSDIIRDKQRVFDTKALEWMRVKVGESLEAEDWIFLRHHYKAALSNYLAANKIDLDNMSEATLDRARRVAIKEAQRNTYRDASAFANALSNFSKKNAGAALLVEGLMPFKKTPVNILKRSVEYSPAGLVKALTTDLYKVSKGDMTASEYIDRICCSFTGTGVVALGMFLKSLGVISGASDDDKEKEFDELTGVQNYSLTIGGHNYTLDWLAPFSLPFFTGVEMQNTIDKGENIGFRNGVEALSNMSEPFFEMSMLQGLTGTVDTIKQSNSSEIAGNVAWNIGTNYVNQAVPTLFGQVARTVDGTQRRSYDDKNKDVPSDVQYFVQGLMKKIPGDSQNLEPYVDEWGREKKTENVGVRAFQNMLSPGYYSTVKISPMEKELKRLYGEVGDEDGMKIFPTAAAKNFELDDGTKKNLTATEYTEMQTVQGQTAYNLLTEIVKTDEYKKADDYTKGVIVSKVYEAASANARYTVSEGEKTSNTAWVNETVGMLQDGDSKGAMNHIIKSGVEKVEGEKFTAAKDGYKDKFEYDASQYSEAEIKIFDTVESDWAGYHASVDMGRELEDSDYKYIRLYEENLSDDMPIEEYAGVRAYVKTEAIKSDPEGSENNLSSKELQDYLDSTDYNENVKGALFMALGGSTWINPYTGLKNNGEVPKGKSGSGSSSGGSSGGRTSSRSSSRTTSRTTRSTRSTTRRSNR
ncbi:MAG: hypothetical protein E7406_01740 [Ruminococcaceae bacterium]|nr:hypothetical protein [Oscillospiraceae bacterium]